MPFHTAKSLLKKACNIRLLIVFVSVGIVFFSVLGSVLATNIALFPPLIWDKDNHQFVVSGNVTSTGTYTFHFADSDGSSQDIYRDFNSAGDFANEVFSLEPQFFQPDGRLKPFVEYSVIGNPGTDHQSGTIYCYANSTGDSCDLAPETPTPETPTPETPTPETPTPETPTPETPTPETPTPETPTPETPTPETPTPETPTPDIVVSHTPTATPPPGECQVKPNSGKPTNIRRSPEIKDNILGIIPDGKVARITGLPKVDQNNTRRVWYPINYNGIVGWVRTDAVGVGRLSNCGFSSSTPTSTFDNDVTDRLKEAGCPQYVTFFFKLLPYQQFNIINSNDPCGRLREIITSATPKGNPLPACNLPLDRLSVFWERIARIDAYLNQSNTIAARITDCNIFDWVTGDFSTPPTKQVLNGSNVDVNIYFVIVGCLPPDISTQRFNQIADNLKSSNINIGDLLSNSHLCTLIRIYNEIGDLSDSQQHFYDLLTGTCKLSSETALETIYSLIVYGADKSKAWQDLIKQGCPNAKLPTTPLPTPVPIPPELQKCDSRYTQIFLVNHSSELPSILSASDPCRAIIIYIQTGAPPSSPPPTRTIIVPPASTPVTTLKSVPKSTPSPTSPPNSNLDSTASQNPYLGNYAVGVLSGQKDNGKDTIYVIDNKDSNNHFNELSLPDGQKLQPTIRKINGEIILAYLSVDESGGVSVWAKNLTTDGVPQLIYELSKNQVDRGESIDKDSRIAILPNFAHVDDKTPEYWIVITIKFSNGSYVLREVSYGFTPGDLNDLGNAKNAAVAENANTDTQVSMAYEVNDGAMWKIGTVAVTSGDIYQFGSLPSENLDVNCKNPTFTPNHTQRLFFICGDKVYGVGDGSIASTIFVVDSFVPSLAEGNAVYVVKDDLYSTTYTFSNGELLIQADGKKLFSQEGYRFWGVSWINLIQ